MEEVLYKCTVDKSHPLVRQDDADSAPLCCGEPMVPDRFQAVAATAVQAQPATKAPVTPKSAQRAPRKSKKR